MQNSVTELPFNQFPGIESSSTPARLLHLPAGERYLNHLGTVHASALMALAEASSGEFLLRHFGSANGIVPVVRRMEVKFRRPAFGEVTSTATASLEDLAQIERDLAAKGRAFISISVELRDEADTHVLSASVEWFLQCLSDSASKES